MKQREILGQCSFVVDARHVFTSIFFLSPSLYLSAELCKAGEAEAQTHEETASQRVIEIRMEMSDPEVVDQFCSG